MNTSPGVPVFCDISEKSKCPRKFVDNVVSVSAKSLYPNKYGPNKVCPHAANAMTMIKV